MSEVVAPEMTAAEAELKRNLETTQIAINNMVSQLRREGVSQAVIKESLTSMGAELEEEVRRRGQTLKADSGSTLEKSILVTHPLQEIMLLNEINATPIGYTRFQHDDGRYYDRYDVLRLTVTGERKPTQVFFDVTRIYERLVALTGRRAVSSAVATGPTACGGCGKRSQSALMWRCSGCKTVYYCDSICQSNHWRNGHKAVCKGIRQTTAQLEQELGAPAPAEPEPTLPTEPKYTF